MDDRGGPGAQRARALAVVFLGLLLMSTTFLVLDLRAGDSPLAQVVAVATTGGMLAHLLREARRDG